MKPLVSHAKQPAAISQAAGAAVIHLTTGKPGAGMSFHGAMKPYASRPYSRPRRRAHRGRDVRGPLSLAGFVICLIWAPITCLLAMWVTAEVVALFGL